MTEPPQVVFISATRRDLGSAVRRLQAALEADGYRVIGMEGTHAAPGTPAKVSQSWASECDIFIGLYGSRYGTISPDRRRSITELEYDQASIAGRRRLCYFAIGWPPGPREPKKSKQRLELFKSRIAGELVLGRFTKATELVKKVRGDLSKLRHGNPIGFDSRELKARMRQYAAERAASLTWRLLEGHGDLVPCPLMSIWQMTWAFPPWHVRQGEHTRELILACDEEPRLAELKAKALAIDWHAAYRHLQGTLMALAGPKTFAELRAILQETRRTDMLHERARRVHQVLMTLQRDLQYPEFRQCFAVTGTHGAGKAHFFASLLNAAANGTGPLLLPMGPIGGQGTIEQVVLLSIRQAMGQQYHERCGIRTLAELSSLLQETPIVFAFDELENWLRTWSAPPAQIEAIFDRCSGFRSFRWLFLIGHRAIDQGIRLKPVLEAWGALGRLDLGPEDTQVDSRRVNIPAHIGGCIDLDTLDEEQDVGIKIIGANLDHLEKEEAELATQLIEENVSAHKNLNSPFVAWSLIEAWRRQERTSVEYHFLGFVRTFFSRRKDALSQDLASSLPAPSRSIEEVEAHLNNVLQGVAAWVLRKADIQPEQAELIEALRADRRVTTSIADAKDAVLPALVTLEKSGLLRSEQVASDGFFVQRYRLGFEWFWEYQFAERLVRDTPVTMHEARRWSQRICRSLEILPSADMRESALSFALLILDEDARKRPSIAQAVANVWRSTMTLGNLSRTAAWFAGSTASSSVQSILIDAAEHVSDSLDARELLALMYFANRAGDRDVMKPEARLALIRPHIGSIARAGLGEYYAYVARCQLGQVEDATSLSRCMIQLCGCAPTGVAAQLASLSVAKLNSLVPTFEERFGAMFEFLRRHPRELDDSSRTGIDGKPWERVHFVEFALQAYCHSLVTEFGLAAFDRLYDRRWYQAARLAFSPIVAHSMEREANIALGHQYRRFPGKSTRDYVALVSRLSGSSSAGDLSLAFHLIRHTVATHGDRDAPPKKRFEVVLESLVRNPRFSRDLIASYLKMLKRALPHLASRLDTLASEALARRAKRKSHVLGR